MRIVLIIFVFSVAKAEDCYQEACKLFPQETDKIKGNGMITS